MTLVDVMNVPQVSDPQISSNGRVVRFVRSEPTWKPISASAIWKVSSDGTGATQMTSGTDGDSSPRWSLGKPGEWGAFYLSSLS